MRRQLYVSYKRKLVVLIRGIHRACKGIDFVKIFFVHQFNQFFFFINGERIIGRQLVVKIKAELVVKIQ